MAVKPPPGFEIIDGPEPVVSVPEGFSLIDSTDEPVQKESLFQRYGKALPIAGSIAGGLAGGTAGTVFGVGVGAVPGAVGGATLGGAAGEAARQMVGRVMGEDVPMTYGQAAKDIGIEGAISGAGELAGLGVGRVAKEGFKAFPKIANAVSGSPAVNFARAQKRGFRVFTPGVGRSEAGAAKKTIEDRLFGLFYKPEEKVAIDLNKRGFANELIENAALKIENGERLTPKEAIGVRRAVDIVFPPQSAKGAPLGARLENIRKAARQVISEDLPELSDALVKSEKSITASQLRMPLRVNRTNPNQISGLATTLGAFRPLALAATVPFSPLAMGTAAAGMGAVRKAVPAGVRHAIQRTGIQSLSRALGDRR